MSKLWLPETALHDAIMLSKVQNYVQRWLDDLSLAGNKIKICSLSQEDLRLETAGTQSNGVKIRFDERHLEKLLYSESDLFRNAKSIQDKAFLKTVLSKASQKLLEELTSDVDEIFSEGFEPSDWVSFEVLDFQEVVFAEISFSREFATSFRRGELKSNRTPLEPTAFSLALDQINVELGAFIGGSQLSAKDVLNIAVGDILMIDKTSDEELELTVNGNSVNRSVDLQIRDNQAFLALE